MPTRASDAPDVVDLPASPASARDARRHVRTVLARAGRDAWVEDAELAVSEVVTNAVLHAHTSLSLQVLVREHDALVEVRDGSPVLPLPRRPSDGGQAADTSTTGRGLTLLTGVTSDRGLRIVPDGKVVWFTVGDAGARDAVASSADSDRGAWTPEVAPPDQAGQAVVLLAMPTVLWTAAREHHLALLRELVLYLAEHADALPQPPDLAQADAARSLVWTALQARLDATPGQPPRAVDLQLRVPPDLVHAFGALQDALDAAERLAEQDLLLVRPGLPELIAVRDWACDQVVAQLAGVPASPWPGTDQERFTVLMHDRDRPAAAEWNSATVTGSTRAVVAVDDANRIVAVSDCLARLTGWDPAELVGRRLVSLVPPRLREAHVAGFSRHLTTGKATLLGNPLELPVLHRDGRELPCRVLLERAEGTGRPVYLGWVEPVTS